MRLGMRHIVINTFEQLGELRACHRKWVLEQLELCILYLVNERAKLIKVVVSDHLLDLLARAVPRRGKSDGGAVVAGAGHLYRIPAGHHPNGSTETRLQQ